MDKAFNEGTNSIPSDFLKMEKRRLPNERFPILKITSSPKIADITFSALCLEIDNKSRLFILGETILYPSVPFSRSALESVIISNSHCKVKSDKFVAVIGLLSCLAYLERNEYESMFSEA